MSLLVLFNLKCLVLSINFYSISDTYSVIHIHSKFTIKKNSVEVKRICSKQFSLSVTYPGRLNSNYRVINNTILQRKKNTSTPCTFNKKVNIRLHNYLHNYKYNTVRTMAREIISKVFTNNYIIIMLEKYGHSVGETS